MIVKLSKGRVLFMLFAKKIRNTNKDKVNKNQNANIKMQNENLKLKNIRNL